MEPKKPAKKAAKKAVKKAAAPTPPAAPKPAWAIERALFDNQHRVQARILEGYEPFAVDSGWVYLKKPLA